MGLVFRKMQDNEATILQSLGGKCHRRSLEGLFVSKPKEAIVAEKDGEIVGYFSYKIEYYGDKKLGVVKHVFGLGEELCKYGVSQMWAEGCDYITAIIRDDNYVSWSTFERFGFVRASMTRVINTLEFGGFMKLYLNNMYGLYMGCDCFFAVNPDKPKSSYTYEKKPGINQMVFHHLNNTILALILLLASIAFSDFEIYGGISRIPTILLSVLAVFLGVNIFTFVGTLFTRRKWEYRMSTGGTLLSLIVSFIGNLFPIVGNWYPKQYDNTPTFRREMGITAIFPWLFLMGVSIILRLWGSDITFLDADVLIPIVDTLLLLRCIPFFAINLGSSRVLQWNKILWAVMALVSILLGFGQFESVYNAWFS